MFSAESKQVEELFDLEREGLSEALRTTGVQDIFARLVVPFLTACKKRTT